MAVNGHANRHANGHAYNYYTNTKLVAPDKEYYKAYTYLYV